MEFRIGLVALAIASVALAPGALAKSPQKSNLQEQATDFTVSDGQTVSQAEMIDAARKLTQERSQIRNNEDFDLLRRGAEQAKLDLLRTQREKEREEFLLKHVPVAYRLAGDKEVKQYIRDHLLPESDGASAKGFEVTSVWRSSDSALTVPSSAQPVWRPVIAEVSRPASDAELVNTEVVEVPPEPEKNGEPTAPAAGDDAHQASLEALGLTQSELDALVGEPSQPPAEPPAELSTTVVIRHIDIERVVLMGKQRFADVAIEFDAIRGTQKRTIAKNFSRMELGYLFQVENTRFELTALDHTKLVLTNLESNQSHRKLVN